MKCPACDVHLLMTERQGVEIDYCPQCRGIWLDRGELDILIERSKTAGGGRPANPIQQQGEEYRREPYHDERRYYDEHHRSGHRQDEHYGKSGQRRKSFLEDLFDFGD
ncbi:zf-TFIIB domain-containing protein [Desulforhabdus sp. TSK]|uniref:TFIIB-type zinc ribbon-containing protein n=1 Tax=Desulforhabdus sp. TSK TaxID=2925014 RepID=UPI001FC7F604|nr:zf-TFIIB domain-containing protein [Desulforhabdus sp. TSK]GKT08554.1 hypothetical protein DSTSK_18590 [Desulforhabdus sp. TSK]